MLVRVVRSNCEGMLPVEALVWEVLGSVSDESMLMAGTFFFSCRRRHTSCLSDWSSDVCSSDLADAGTGTEPLFPDGLNLQDLPMQDVLARGERERRAGPERRAIRRLPSAVQDGRQAHVARSEERRVGEGGRRGGHAEA